MEKKYVFYFDQGEGLNGTIFSDVRGNNLSRIRGEGGGEGRSYLLGNYQIFYLRTTMKYENLKSTESIKKKLKHKGFSLNGRSSQG